MERWSDAAAAADLGIKKGGLEDTGQAYILLGIAEYRSGNLPASKDAFTSATKPQPRCQAGPGNGCVLLTGKRARAESEPRRRSPVHSA